MSEQQQAGGTHAATATQRPVVEARDVVAGYLPGVNILNGCSLTAYPGEMIGIIGPNGAGKSTLLKAMFGLVKVHSGSVMLGDRDITNLRTNQLVEMGVGFVPQTNNVFPSLSIEENLRMGLFLRPKKVQERLAAMWDLFPVLHDRRNQSAGALSGGERQSLAMARALMAGVDEAIARGWADADRLGVCGLSGGGNLSCWIVGQTDRFKAAVPENPVTNWVSFYGTSDIGVWFAVEQLGGHPHEIPEIYAQCSPITYAHRCTTPTLLVQGEHDWRCPAEQGEQFYNVLKANGCVAEMVRLPNASHGGAIEGTPANRRAQNEALLEWMQRFLNNGVENVSRSTCERVGD